MKNEILKIDLEFRYLLTLQYLLSEQDVISEQGGAKFHLMHEKKIREVKKFNLMHEKNVQGGKKLQNS